VALFCSGRWSLGCNSVAAPGFVKNSRPGTAAQNNLIEHRDENGVELIMRRARAVLISMIPALALIASLHYFSSSFQGGTCGYSGSGNVLSPCGHGKHENHSATNSSDQALRRSSRRSNVQPGADGFAPPAAAAQGHSAIPRFTVEFSNSSQVGLELVQSWQFYWRTALEARAPSLIS
jgi:hypothetical protein